MDNQHKERVELGIEKAKKILEGNTDVEFSLEELEQLQQSSVILACPSSGDPKWLHDIFKASLIDSIDSLILPSLRGKFGETASFFKELKEVWSKYKAMAQRFCWIFKGLEKNLGELNGRLNKTFGKYVLRHYYDASAFLALDWIRLDCAGKQIDRDLLKDVIIVFSEVNHNFPEESFYEVYFEHSMLRQMERHYNDLVSLHRQEINSFLPKEFTEKVYLLWNEEKERVKCYLLPSTESQLLEVFKNIVLKTAKEVMIKSMTFGEEKRDSNKEEWVAALKELKEKLSNFSFDMEAVEVEAKNEREQMETLDRGVAKATRILAGEADIEFTLEELEQFQQSVDFLLKDKLWVRERFIKALKDSITSIVLPSWEGKHGETLLKELKEKWSKYQAMGEWLCKIFEHCASIHDGILTRLFSFEAFRKYFFDFMDAALELIRIDRDGQQINQDLLRDVLIIFSELKDFLGRSFYEQDFEVEMLKQTRIYYTQLACQVISSPSLGEFKEKVSLFWNQEKGRANYYLLPSTESKLLKTFKTKLLAQAMDIISTKPMKFDERKGEKEEWVAALKELMEKLN